VLYGAIYSNIPYNKWKEAERRVPEILLQSQTLAPNRPAAWKAKLARLYSPFTHKGRIEYGLGLGGSCEREK
jgi:hypothetical protein